VYKGSFSLRFQLRLTRMKEPERAINRIFALTRGVDHSDKSPMVLSKRSLIHSPRRRLYPPACKPYGLEAKPEAQTASS
jgi:hypothetical protein